MLFLLSLLGFLVGDAESATCKALSMEGGGSHGAYEAGVIWGLAKGLPDDEVNWNVVTGISTGAINSGGVAQFPMGQEKEMADSLVNFWLSLNNNSAVYVEWTGGLIEGLIYEYGIFNNAPCKKTVKHYYNKGFHRNITVGATNYNNATTVQFNERMLGDEMIEGIISSGSPPPFFPHQQFMGSVYADGGCIVNLDYFAAVERCREVVDKDSDIIVDLIFDHKPTLYNDTKVFTTLDVAWRVYQEIKPYDNAFWFYYSAQNAYPEVNFRYVIFNTQFIPDGYVPGVPLDFSKKVLEKEVKLGKKDAQRAINNKEDFKKLIDEEFRRNNEVIYP